MKRTAFVVVVVVLTLAVPALTRAHDAAALYKAKCVSCHAPDGTGSAIGKKMGARDFRDPEIAKQSDQQLIDAITKGKNKMPKYEGKLTAEQIKELVAYIREVQKKK